MGGTLAPLDREPVSGDAPFISYPSGQYRHEYAEERKPALREVGAGLL